MSDRVFFYNPLNIKKPGVLVREEFLEELNKMNYIKNKSFGIRFGYEEKFFLKEIFGIFRNEVVKKVQNNKFLDIMTIYEKLEFFQNCNIFFIKEMINEFDYIIIPCIRCLENTFIDTCKFGGFKASEIYLKIIKSFIEIKPIFTKNSY